MSRRPVDIYVRVSRRGGREHFQSPEDQEAEARRFAEGHGLQVGDVFRDIDVGGASLERPGLGKVLERVKRGDSGGVVVAYLSRLSRNTTQGLQLLDLIRSAGGQVYAPNLPSDSRTADGRMLTTIQLAVDAGYRERKAEEFERAKEAAIANGIPVANRPPAGYIKGADRRLEPHPENATVIREVFERRAAGESPSALARVLEQAGVRTSQGSSTWTKQAVAGLLRSRVYLGELSYGRPPRFVNTRAHEPIIDFVTWNAAQRPKTTAPQPARGTGEYALTGVLRCAACGYSCQGTRTSRGRRIYRCTRRHAGGVCPEPVRARAEVVEAAAERVFWEITDDLVARAYQQDDADVGALRRALDQAQALLDQAKSPEVQAEVGDDWLQMLRERRELVESAAQELRDAQAAAEDSANTPEFVTSLRAEWNSLSPADKRELFAARLDALALGRRGGGLVLAAYPAGSAPHELTRPGFRRGAGLRPFDVPDAARLLPLHDPREDGGDGGG